MRIEDAVHAARAACEEGIVAGGGIALFNTIPKLQSRAEGLDGDERTGVMILAHAVQAPVRQIADNAGMKGDAVVKHLLNEPPGTGYDAARECYTDMLKRQL